MQHELAFAQSAALASAERLCSAQGGGVDGARGALAAALASGAPAGRWVWHVDEFAIVLALLLDGEPALGLVHATGAEHAGRTVFGTYDDGTRVHEGGEGDGTAECVAGGASECANVIHVPPDAHWCAQLDAAVDHLRHHGVGMPVELRARAGRSAVEGLLDVVLSAADLHLAPPAAFSPRQSAPPPAVLCAFEVLLAGAGGALADAYGDALRPAEVLARAEAVEAAGGPPPAASLRRGIVAAHEAVLPYFVRAIGSAFPRGELDGSIGVPPSLFDGALARRLAGFGDGEFTVEYGALAVPEAEAEAEDEGDEPDGGA